VQQILRGKYYIHGQATHHLITFYSKQKGDKKPKEKRTIVANPLSQRVFQVLQLIAEGLSNEDIAKVMQISDKTVKNHVSHILIALEVNNRTAAVIKAIQNGWVTIPNLE